MVVTAGSAVRIADESTIRYQPSEDSGNVGRVGVRVNGEAVLATLDPNDSRIVIDARAAIVKRLRTFGGAESADGGAPAVADSLSLGEIMMTNVPITIAPLSRGVTMTVGLMFLARYAPTFDGAHATITLRATGLVPWLETDVRTPLLLTPQGPQTLIGGRWLSLTAPELRAERASHRTTIDLHRGELVFQR